MKMRSHAILSIDEKFLQRGLDLETKTVTRVNLSSNVITRSIHNPISARVAELKMKKKKKLPQISIDIIVKNKCPLTV